MPTNHRSVCVSLVLSLGVASAAIAAVVADRESRPAAALTIDRTQYPGSQRLSDAELATFLGALGHRFPPGSFIPLWANRFVERERELPRRRRRAQTAAPVDGLVAAGPNVDVSADPLHVHSESSIAIDQTNPLRIIAASNQNFSSGDALLIYWSNDGGATWTTVELGLGTADYQNDPSVGWDSQGNAYVSALGCDSASCEVQVAKSVDGGQTWSVPQTVHAHTGNDKELLTVDRHRGSACQETVCVAWNKTRTDGLQVIHVSCSADGAGPWPLASLAVGNLLAPIPAFGPGGELLVAWQNLDARTIDIARSDDCGQTFSAPIPVGPIRFPFDLRIPPICRRGAFIYPVVDVDRSFSPRRGWVYATWTDAAPGATCPLFTCSDTCEADVRFARSEDGGATWSAPVTIHTDDRGVDQFNPWLAADDSDGSLHVMWYDTRGDVARLKSNVFYRRSIDGGDTWEAEIQVTTAQTDETEPGADPAQYGDYNGLAAFQCRSFPIWTDRRDGGSEQIYTGDVTGGGGAPPDIGNTLRGVRGIGANPTFSWTDLGGAEADYRIYGGPAKDPVVSPPPLLGLAGGPDAVAWTDAASPTSGIGYYKVRGIGPCGEELSTW